MKVTLIAVSSIDGKITKWEEVQDVSAWASPEDQEFFMSMIQKHKVIVMGRKTYEAVKGNLKLEIGKLRIVLTSHPVDFAKAKIEGKLEFSSQSPNKLVERLENEGYDEILLVGGSAIYTSFIKTGLVTDLYLTIEPVFFGKGKMIAIEENLDIKLKLESVKRLNLGGTLLLHFIPLR